VLKNPPIANLQTVGVHFKKMRFFQKITILTFLVVLSTSIQAQQADKENLRKFAIRTIHDQFIDKTSQDQKVLFLPFVKNEEDSVLLELKQSNLDSNLFTIKTEADVRQFKDMNFPISLHYVKVIDPTKDTILINIEEYQIEFKNYFIFKMPIRYSVCLGRGQHFTDGTFIYDYELADWKFISGRERKEKWRIELLEN
jgi:hypothetical protein